MLAALVPDPALPAGWAAGVNWDGWRAAVSVEAGHVVLRSRRGTNLLPAFPEVRAGYTQLPDATALDGELVVWEAGWLAFERLHGRSNARGTGRPVPARGISGASNSRSWSMSSCRCTAHDPMGASQATHKRWVWARRGRSPWMLLRGLWARRFSVQWWPPCSPGSAPWCAGS
ncbi:ATP-dependent DNA ligase [Streptomyces olivaceoviridis]